MSSDLAKIKLMMVSGSFPPIRDGIADYCSRLCRELAGSEKLTIDLITSVRSQDPSVTGLSVHPLVSSWSWAGLPGILKAYRRLKPDIVHIQYPSVSYKRHLMPNLLPLFLRLAGAENIIITLHGFGLYTGLGKLRLTLPAVFSDGVITVSRHIKKSAERFWRGPAGFLTNRLEETVFTGSSIEPGPDLADSRRKELRTRWGVKPGQLAPAYFGFINDGKGFEDLLKAMRICLDQGLDGQLVCLAEFSPGQDKYHQKIKRSMDELRLGQFITFTGYLSPPEVAEALAAVDLAVLPFSYGASTKRSSLLAALACGCPVITTSDESLPEFFETGRNISLVPPKDHVRLAQAMMLIWKDRVLLGKMGEGSKVLADHFSWDKIGEKHIEIYQKHLKRGGK